MLGYMFPHLSHGLTDSDVIVEKLTVSSCLPLGECRKFLRDGVEETNDDTNWGSLHVVAELIDGSSVGNSVMAIELHFFPDGEKDRGNHEDRGPVLQSVSAVYAGV